MTFLTSLDAAYTAVIITLPRTGPLPEGISPEDIGPHLRAALTTHQQLTGSFDDFDLSSWLHGNYPMFQLAPTSSAVEALAVLSELAVEADIELPTLPPPAEEPVQEATLFDETADRLTDPEE